MFHKPVSNIAQKVKNSKMNTDIIFEMEIRAKAFCFCYGMEAGDLRGLLFADPVVSFCKKGDKLW